MIIELFLTVNTMYIICVLYELFIITHAESKAYYVMSYCFHPIVISDDAPPLGIPIDIFLGLKKPNQ